MRTLLIFMKTLAAASLAILVVVMAWLLAAPQKAHAVRTNENRQSKIENGSPDLQGAYRLDQGGWVFIHLQGSPRQIGYQHGYLLAPEILDAFQAVKLLDTHDTHRGWGFFRQVVQEMLWPKIDHEYQDELQGIADGLKARGVALDLDDVVALNAFQEIPDYYVPWYDAKHKVANAPHLMSPGNCSAFVATGGYTRDHHPVMAHNAWTSYLDGERWRVIFDIVPVLGQNILMDGFPGVITSDDDFGVNSGGLLVTETTISQFAGWDPHGTPEFMRSRKALQYARSIDDYVRIMLDGNNGGYANDWLLADIKTGEIAQFELGLKAHRLWRTTDGAFVGSNFPLDPELIAKETTFDPHNPATSPNARRTCWEGLMEQNKGKIDVTLAEKFLAGHYDAFEKRDDADERSLCGHVEASPRGVDVWDWPPHYPGGAAQGKVIDSAMAKDMSFYARMGHPCGEDFLAAPFLKTHPEFAWQAPLLRDMKAGSWTRFQAGERAP
ncbi:MAG: C45 family peptidase [Terriglobia bacterium]